MAVGEPAMTGFGAEAQAMDRLSVAEMVTDVLNGLVPMIGLSWRFAGDGTDFLVGPEMIFFNGGEPV